MSTKQFPQTGYLSDIGVYITDEGGQECICIEENPLSVRGALLFIGTEVFEKIIAWYEEHENENDHTQTD